MYIEPNTTIKILKNCPLDTTYDHTIYFANASAQSTYFLGLAKYSLDKQTYQRVNRNRMRVQLVADNLYDCNYIMFQNTNFGTKWFYAYIKSVEYVNNITSEIEYEIDVMQTWHFDYDLGECFVEREHSSTDKIGDNTVPENVETGPYITTSTSNLTVNQLGMFMLASEKVVTGDVDFWQDPGIVGGFPVPCYWLNLGVLSDVNVEYVKTIIDAYATAGKSDAIIAIFTAPYNMISIVSGARTQTIYAADRKLSFTPKNKKLYTYPYCCLAATALGEGIELKYELFSGDPSFTVRGGFGANPQICAIPQNYAGLNEAIEYTLSIKDFPVCAWVNNYYQNWLAQNKASIAVSTIGGLTVTGLGAIGLAAAPATGGVSLAAAGAVLASAAGVAGSLASQYQHSVIPDRMVGSANAADIFAVTKLSGFYTMCKTIRPEYGRIIDEYFTMYGYKTNRVKKPNRNVRPHWTYTKTIGCVAHGSVPSDDMKKICNIYNNGITFWRNGNEIGNYSLDNSV